MNTIGRPTQLAVKNSVPVVVSYAFQIYAMGPLNVTPEQLGTPPQVQCQWKLQWRIKLTRTNDTRSMAELYKTGHPARFGFKGVYRELLERAPAGMRHMIAASGNRLMIPGIHHVKDQRRMNANGGMQACRGLPGSIPHGGYKFAIAPGSMQRQQHTVDGNLMPSVNHPARLNLQTFHRRIHKAHGAATQYCPVNSQG